MLLVPRVASHPEKDFFFIFLNTILSPALTTRLVMIPLLLSGRVEIAHLGKYQVGKEMINQDDNRTRSYRVFQ